MPGGASFDPAHATASGTRYRGRIERVRDAVQGGGEPEEIELARPAAVLLAPGRDPGGYTTLPVAEISGLRADGGVALTEGFLPPALATGAVPFYGQLLQEVVTGLDRIAEAHGRMVLGGVGTDGREPAGARARQHRPAAARAHAGAGGLSSGRALPRARRARGADGDLRLGVARMTTLPAYDHLAPTPAFAALTDTLRSLILSLRYVEPKSRALPVRKRETNVWAVRIDSPEILDGSRIVVRVGSELSDDSLRKIFVHQVTVGSAGEFDTLWKSRLPGIPLKPLHSQPREIPYDGDRLCLELDQKSEHWGSLRDSPGFMIGVSGALPSEPQLDCFAVHR